MQESFFFVYLPTYLIFYLVCSTLFNFPLVNLKQVGILICNSVFLEKLCGLNESYLVLKIQVGLFISLLYESITITPLIR